MGVRKPNVLGNQGRVTYTTPNPIVLRYWLSIGFSLIGITVAWQSLVSPGCWRSSCFIPASAITQFRGLGFGVRAWDLSVHQVGMLQTLMLSIIVLLRDQGTLPDYDLGFPT